MPKQLLVKAGLAGTLLLTSAGQKLKSLPEKPPELRLPMGLVNSEELKELLGKFLKKSLPSASRVLTAKEEKELLRIIQRVLGIKAAAQLDGQRLNHQMGLIGLEQHLPRFPGDSLAGRNFPEVGLTKGRGAWGYFVSSAGALTQADIDREKYYIAVQTLYLPEWQTKHNQLKQWYAFRKMLVINPLNGAAVVTAIGDAGPAKWTGKQFGGSPQVMFDLGFYPKKTKGRVVVLFIDDPENNIPLGPVRYRGTKPPAEV
jgi:hypothetical protein